MDKKEVKNLEEAKKLVEKYRSITLEELDLISSVDDPIWKALAEITGFGGIHTCSLCHPLLIPNHVGPNCSKCIYYINKKDFSCLHDKTYDAIMDSRSTEELLQAIKNRADYIESLIKQYENN